MVRALRGAAAVLWLAGSGCTSLREIPRSQYAAKPERKDVHVLTREGLAYEFDYVEIDADTLVGYRRRDTEGPVPDYSTLRLALDDVSRLEARQVNWTRTGLIGAAGAAVVVAAGMRVASQSSGSEGSGGGKPPGGGIP